MKILGFNPKDFYTGWPVQSDFGRWLYGCPGLTFPVLKRLLPPGNEMKFIDGFFDPVPMSKYLELMKWPDVAACNIASSYGSLNYAIAIKQLKRINPKVKIIAGGHHASLYRKRWLQMGVDVIATGESELIFGALIGELAGAGHFERVPGVAFMADGQYVETESPPQLKSLDESPAPDLDLINFSSYVNYMSPRKGWVGSLESSRGCMFRCKFCTTPVYWKGTQRYKSMSRLAQEIEALIAHDVALIMVVDDGFGNDSAYSRELINLFKRYRDRINWCSFVRIDSVLKEPDLIDLAAQSGMLMNLIGFESLDEEVLKDAIGKGLRVQADLEALSDIYQRFQRNKVLVIGTFISGHPEIEAGKRASYLAARKVCDDPRLADYMPFPGTGGYDKLSEQVRIKDMFFHDAKLQIFPEHNIEAFRFNLLNILDLPRSARLLYSGPQYRGYLLRTHRFLWERFFRVNRRKLRDYLLFRRKGLSADQKQDQLFRWYLDDPAYQAWLDSRDDLVWF